MKRETQDRLSALGYVLFLIIITLIALSLSGCGINPYQDDPPPEGYKEVRCTYASGKGRYGTLMNYVKGDVDMAKLTLYGDVDYQATCSSDDDGTVRVEVNAVD